MKLKQKQKDEMDNEESDSGLFHRLFPVGLLMVVLGLLLLLVLLLLILALFAHGLGHKLLEGHVIAFFLGVACGLKVISVVLLQKRDVNIPSRRYCRQSPAHAHAQYVSQVGCACRSESGHRHHAGHSGFQTCCHATPQRGSCQ
jgi:hypothetical protein